MKSHANPDERVDALVVLGCRVRRDGRPGAALLRRVTKAWEIAQRLDVPFVLVSGGRRWHGTREADAMHRALVSLGWSPERILLEAHSLSTMENARFTARQIAASDAIGSIGVVTCDWHMRRALDCFRAAGLAAAPFAAPSPPVGRARRLGRALRERGSWWLTEAATRLGVWR